jgi:hypothetical protein
MNLIAHIGNVPVEEWLPFLFPILALYLYGRHWTRRRRAAVSRLPDASQPLDDGTVEVVASEWAKAGHHELGREHLPLLYPPGPDGATPDELATRAAMDPAEVERLLEELEELGYLDQERASGEARIWLTADGYGLVNVTEAALLSCLSERATAPP